MRALRLGRLDVDRNQLIERHRPLVERIARTILLRVPPSVTWDELVSAGYLGLIEAVDRYEPERNVDFSAFARSRIRGAMLDALREMDVLPRSVRDRVNAIYRAGQKIERETGEAPDDESIANELGIDVARVRDARRYHLVAQTVSVDENAPGHAHEGDTVTVLERLADQEALSVEELIALQDARDAIRVGFGQLPERLRMLLILYYIEELTMQEIAVVMKVTIGRISQLHASAIDTLRATIVIDGEVDQRRLALLFRDAVLSES